MFASERLPTFRGSEGLPTGHRYHVSSSFRLFPHVLVAGARPRRIGVYLANAKRIRAAMTPLGFSWIGGDNAPYLWINPGRDSWEFFDLLLNQAPIVCTPGAGFGRCGEGHVRSSAFNSRENVETALARIAAALK